MFHRKAVNIGVKSGDSIPPPATYRQGCFCLFVVLLWVFLDDFWLVSWFCFCLFVDGRAWDLLLSQRLLTVKSTP